MAFWCIFFMKFFMLVFGMLSSSNLMMDCSYTYSSSNSGCDRDKGICLPSFVSCFLN